MPSLVATTSALARKTCVRMHFVRTNYEFLDVTLACVDVQMEAQKVSINNFSSFFGTSSF